MEHQEILRKALDLLVINESSSLPTDIKGIVKREGYQVITRGKGQGLIDVFGLTEYARTKPAFSAKHGESYYIFLSDALNSNAKDKAIAHEIGHILLHNIGRNGVFGWSDESKWAEIYENEADDFALCLLAPPPMLIQHKVKGVDDIMRLTGLSHADSQIARQNLLDYQDQYRVVHSGDRLMHEPTRRSWPRYLVVGALVFLLLVSIPQLFTPEPLPSNSSPSEDNDIIISETVSTEASTTTEPETTVPTTTTTETPTTTTKITTVPVTTTLPPTTTTTTLPPTTTTATTTVTTTKATTTTTKTVRKTTKPTSSMVFWTDAGDRYHLYLECQTLQHSAAIRCGTIEEADKAALCYYCESRYLRESN